MKNNYGRFSGDGRHAVNIPSGDGITAKRIKKAVAWRVIDNFNATGRNISASGLTAKIIEMYCIDLKIQAEMEVSEGGWITTRKGKVI